MNNRFKKIIEKHELNQLKWLDLVWLISFPILNINYVIAASIASKGQDISLYLDRIIPFESIFIFPYIYWYIYIFIGLIFILLKDSRKYMRGILVMSMGLVICYLVYFLFPVEITRPTINSNTISNKLVNAIYEIDKPFNCFPSIHVLSTYIVMRFTAKKDSKLWFYYTVIVGIVIMLSTLFIKQHFILDGVVAIILGEIVIFLCGKIENKYIDSMVALPYKLIYKVKDRDDIQA